MTMVPARVREGDVIPFFIPAPLAGSFIFYLRVDIAAIAAAASVAGCYCCYRSGSRRSLERCQLGGRASLIEIGNSI